jgi:hypothetical protein
MALVHEKIRRPDGMTANGTPLTEVVITGQWRRPESIEEWAEQRIAGLGAMADTYPAGRAVIALLQAGEDADVKAAGQGLDEHGRYAVLRVLQIITDKSDGYPPGLQLARKLHTAWRARWGDAVPGQPRVQERLRVV